MCLNILTLLDKKKKPQNAQPCMYSLLLMCKYLIRSKWMHVVPEWRVRSQVPRPPLSTHSIRIYFIGHLSTAGKSRCVFSSSTPQHTYCIAALLQLWLTHGEFVTIRAVYVVRIYILNILCVYECFNRMCSHE